MDQLTDFFENLFDTGKWPPRWHCGKWSEFHGWLYIISDLLIWAAYFTIPFLLIQFIVRKKDIPFPKIFWLFGTFILACGTTHLIDALIFWVPIYNFSALIRFFTALVSWGTIIALYKILPEAFSLKTPAELERVVNERTNELHKSIQKSKFIADAMPQIVWNAKPDGTVEYVNVQGLKYTGKSLEELSGEGWADILHPQDRDKFLEKFTHALNNLDEFEFESRIQNAEGKYLWHLTRALPHRDEDGNILIWVGTATDIEIQKQNASMLERKVDERTEQLRHVNSQLVQSNSDLESFASVASHDLQAPLRTITTYLSMLVERNSDSFDEQSKKYISRSLEVGQRMRSLIENLLMFSKINAEQAKFTDLDLNEVMNSVVANLNELIEKRNAVITNSNLPTIYGDETQMQQLFQNLLSNAIVYNISETPTVTIDCTNGIDDYTISIADNGNGIDAEYLSKVFDVFARFDTQHKGTGLGLAICKKIVEKHGGRIWAESVLNEGTTFYFSVPKKYSDK